MKTREKIVIAILLGVLASWLFSCTREHYVSVPQPANGTVDVEYLQRTYAAYNNGYFQNKLTDTPKIDLLEPDPTNMASTYCDPDGGCVIHLNTKYVAAPRVGDQTLLHEMCHIKTWMQDMDDKGLQVDHGKHWRTCMLNLDTQGAFREIIIDGYAETMP
jgi:hypothetical protein